MPSSSEGAGTRRARPGISENGVSAAGRERVEQIQRARLIAAMVEVSYEHELADATVARVVARAGVSRRTFYELFEDREDCFLAALDEGIARTSRYVLDSYDPRAGWVERVRIALSSLLSFLDAERDLARLLIVASPGAGQAAFERRRRVLAQMIAAIDEGRIQSNGGSQPPPLTAEGIVGGGLSVIHACLVNGKPGRLVELANPLMSMIVLPYLGQAAARRELARRAPRPRARVESENGDPLRELDMRLTYRTVCVLTSVAANAGGSNREIGLASGIVDQGQISKLLRRLERLGLVQNDGHAQGKGMPNAWVLTAKGVRVERAMSAEGGRQDVGASARSRR